MCVYDDKKASYGLEKAILHPILLIITTVLRTVYIVDRYNKSTLYCVYNVYAFRLMLRFRRLFSY